MIFIDESGDKRPLLTSHLYFRQSSDKKLMFSKLRYFSRFATFVKFATLQGVLLNISFSFYLWQNFARLSFIFAIV